MKTNRENEKRKKEEGKEKYQVIRYEHCSNCSKNTISEVYYQNNIVSYSCLTCRTTNYTKVY